MTVRLGQTNADTNIFRNWQLYPKEHQNITKLCLEQATVCKEIEPGTPHYEAEPINSTRPYCNWFKLVWVSSKGVCIPMEGLYSWNLSAREILRVSVDGLPQSPSVSRRTVFRYWFSYKIGGLVKGPWTEIACSFLNANMMNNDCWTCAQYPCSLHYPAIEY